MSNLMLGEASYRQWFALVGYDLYPLGDCGDVEAAAEIATDALAPVGLKAERLIPPDIAQQWVITLASRGITSDINKGEV